MQRLDGALADHFLPQRPLPERAAAEFQRLLKLTKQLSRGHQGDAEKPTAISRDVWVWT